MTSYTQEQLLAQEFEDANKGVLGGLLRIGVYILGATSKVGKSMVATALANAVANGSEYLGKPNTKSKVLYFDNDNYAFETKGRVEALGLDPTENIEYVFDNDASSLDKIKDYIKRKYIDIEDYSLVIVDCFINLSEFSSTEINYQNVYPILTDFRDFIMKKKLVCIILHHTKKGDAKGQDKLLGSKAMSGATTGTILINVEDEYASEGRLEFVLRHKKEIIPIIKDDNGIGWDINIQEHIDINEDIPKSLLNLINLLTLQKDKGLSGTSCELVQKAKMEINPVSLFKYLKKHEHILAQNEISFGKEKTREKRLIWLKFNEVEVENE